MDKKYILNELNLFSLQSGGIGSWLTQNTDDEVFTRLGRLDKEPLTKVQLNQLLAFGHEAPVSDDFFRYYWLTAPVEHPYDVKEIPDFHDEWQKSSAITSIGHLRWGLYRLFTDGLLWFGNVRTAYRKLRSMTQKELSIFFAQRRFNTQLINST